MTGPDTGHSRQRFCIIHGHFYQPPRENPWLDIIEKQDSADPYHDWNERIYDECYRPNAYSRLLDGQGMIRGIHNNYSSLSFNFGPTLFLWLEKNHPAIARRIIDADRQSCERLNGHGNALAQVFNHLIMPLASWRDQLTQIRWAKSFFQSRFNRDPEGMWLAETAINRKTIECLIREDIKFVILSPNQAEAYRPIGDGAQWVNTSHHSIDPRRPYRLFHGGVGRGYIDVFFFDEPLSRAVSFEGLLVDARLLGDRIKSSYDNKLNEDQVVVVATDGETFGHHKPLSDMCLAYFFAELAGNYGLTPVNFGWFLERNQPRFEVNIKNGEGEGTAWSCMHGTGRWSRNCGCSTGGKFGWNQVWRTPLRTALNALQSRVDTAFESALKAYGFDPWILRDAYITEISQPSDISAFSSFIQSKTSNNNLTHAQILHIRRLLEAQKYMLYAFTSCGWFFADISGLEAMQNLAYACRAAQLGLDQPDQAQALEALLNELEKAKSNLPGKTGKSLFTEQIAPGLHHLERIAFAAVAERVLSKSKAGQISLFGYDMNLQPLFAKQVRQKWYTGFRIEASNTRTGEEAGFALMLAHGSGAGVAAYVLPETGKGDTKLTPASWTEHAGALTLQMTDLFLTSRSTLSQYYHKLVDRRTLAMFTDWLHHHLPILQTLSILDNRLHIHFGAPVQYIYTSQWDKIIAGLAEPGHEKPVLEKLAAIYTKIKDLSVRIDYSFSTSFLETHLHQAMEAFRKSFDAKSCDRAWVLLDVVDRFAVPIGKNRLEDMFHTILTETIRPMYQAFNQATHKDELTKAILIRSLGLARRMNFNIDTFPMER
jgi:hypothetical protein